MEQMVIGAVRETPFTSASRTDHFKVRTRAQTPRPRHFSDSREDSDSGPGTDTTGELDEDREHEILHTFNESDSSGERALVSRAFDEPVNLVRATGTHKGAKVDPHSEGFESSGKSSLDATLSKSLGQTTQGEIPASGSGKMPKRKRRGPTRGVPVKDEFFSKIRWTRSFIPGPAEPLHIPIWYGAIYVRRTSQ